MKRVLVTGSRGFVGRNLLEVGAGAFEFVGLDLADGIDLRDPGAFSRLEGSFDAAIHLAGLSFVPESHSRPHDYYSVNFNTALAVAEYCRTKNVSLLIYPNTYVYGAPVILPVGELHPIALPSPYHRSKKLAEDLLLGYFDPSKTKVISLRVFNLYGPHQGKRFLLPQILEQAVKEGRVTVRDLEPRRDFLHIEDFVRLLIAILASVAPDPGVYNVGSGCSHAVRDLITLTSELLGRELQVVDLGERRPGEIMDCYADIRKVQRSFGWAPAKTLRDGVSGLLRDASYV